MKKITKMILAVCPGLGIWIGAWTYEIVKRKREKAAEQEMHIPYGPYEAVFKRPLDIVLSIIALAVFSPVMVGTALFVKSVLGSPVIFTQERPGLGGKIFKMYKFRTMTDEKDAEGVLLPDELRMTGAGKLLRSTSLDELPELINIIKGDMSVVGPRPLLVEYLPRYTQKQKHRHDVRPGLTGLAQTDGRNLISWNEKFEDDVRYVDKITFLGDVKIILDTVKIVLKREGISSSGTATAECFRGNTRENN